MEEGDGRCGRHPEEPDRQGPMSRSHRAECQADEEKQEELEPPAGGIEMPHAGAVLEVKAVTLLLQAPDEGASFDY